MAEALGLPLDKRGPSPQVRRAVTLLGRIGAGSRGLLYALLGLVTVLAAADMRRPTGPKGTLATLLGYPLGRPLIVVLAIGFASFAVFNLLVTLLKPTGSESGWRGVGRRISTFFVACTYASLTAYTIRLALSPHGLRPTLRQNISTLMTMPAGRIALGCIACGIAIFGLFEIGRAFRTHPDKRLRLAQHVLRTVGRLGIAGRGALFVGIAVLLGNVAFFNDPEDAGGIGKVLSSLQANPAGRPLLLIAGISLIAFGAVDVFAPQAPHEEAIERRE